MSTTTPTTVGRSGPHPPRLRDLPGAHVRRRAAHHASYAVSHDARPLEEGEVREVLPTSPFTYLRRIDPTRATRTAYRAAVRETRAKGETRRSVA